MVLDAPLIDTDRLRQVGGSLGSHPAGVYEDAAGQRYYVKTVESVEHARNERLAARLYQLAGAPTLDYLPSASPLQVATVLVPLDKRRVSRLDDEERRQACHWFGVHAWTANWDAAGFDGDNQGVHAGTVLTLDLGGALAYRAQGDPKGRAFGARVDEFDTLRHDPDNPQARRLFGAMSVAELRAAAEVVTRLAPEHIRAVVRDHGGSAALARLLLDRQGDLAQRALQLEGRAGA